MTNELKLLRIAESRAWNAMMNGSETDARTVRGKEGKNYIAWCKAADAMRAYYERQDAA